MKFNLILLISLFASSSFANTWSYQVNVNGNNSSPKSLDKNKSSFDAGAYYCEVTPVTIASETEYRSLVCAVGSATVSTGGFCTKKGAKFPGVQYAILNLSGPKNTVNIVVSCKFD